MSGNDGSDAFDHDEWDSRRPDRMRRLMKELGYKPEDAESISNRQDREIADRIKAGKPLEPLLASIDRNPAATSVEPDKETVRQIEEARTAHLRTEQKRNAAPAPTRPEPTAQPTPQNDSAVAQEAKRQEANKQEFALRGGLLRPPYEVLRDQGTVQPTDKAERIKKLGEEAQRKMELYRSMKQGRGRGL